VAAAQARRKARTVAAARARRRAEAFLDGAPDPERIAALDPERIAALDDKEAIVIIAAVRGLGRWPKSTCGSRWAGTMCFLPAISRWLPPSPI